MGDKFIILRTIVTHEVCDLDNYPDMDLEAAKSYEENLPLEEFLEGAGIPDSAKLISTVMDYLGEPVELTHDLGTVDILAVDYVDKRPT